MGHHHHHHHHAHCSHNQSGVSVAFWLNFLFAVIEIIGGILFNSTAILSDAVHDLGDSLVLGMSVLLEKWSKKEASARYSYGFRRLSLIGAFVNSAILFSGTVFIFVKAVQGIVTPEPVSAGGMFWLSILGIAANGLSIWQVSGKQNILDRSVFAHLLEDLLGWVAVFVVSIVIYFTQWYVLDSLISFVIGGIIFINVLRNLHSIYLMVMQAAPNERQRQQLIRRLRRIAGILQIENLHWWTLDGEHHVVTAHIQLSPQTSAQSTRHVINEVLATYNVVDSTIEFTKGDLS